MSEADELREAVETGVLGFVWSTGDAAAVADVVLALPEVAALRTQATAAQRVRDALVALTEAVGRGDEYGLPEAYRAALAALDGDDRAGQR